MEDPVAHVGRTVLNTGPQGVCKRTSAFKRVFQNGNPDKIQAPHIKALHHRNSGPEALTTGGILEDDRVVAALLPILLVPALKILLTCVRVLHTPPHDES